ncbi:hypothetical protein KUTeg_005530 [Tegillarca granosa]|uniref:Uncharacterized protein n=1 Tax=Tegillarca granosa TaxID=220873 RepID=A0ABQ9FLN4_TEGGR|nr:hypothetical protein KUTeg_005530 [Tegillarca granosa]
MLPSTFYHEIAAKKMQLTVSLDLVNKAKHLVQFLQYVDSNKQLYDEQFIKHAIFRYETLWLPFAAKHDEEILAAPIDIEWVWMCHLLCPHAYVKDCMAVVGKIINHKIVSLEKRQKMLQKTKTLWCQVYGQEKFEILDSDSENIKTEEYRSKISYDLLAAVARQGAFYYQVSLPHYRDAGFLKNGCVRYFKFLYLKSKNPDVFLVPCYDIDLIWHTHQLHPVIYKADTERILGKLYNHDDSVTDRSENSKLTRADFQTRELWKNQFGHNFAQSGAMYRGTSSRGKLYSLTPENKFDISSKSATFVINKIVLEGVPNAQQNNCRFILVIYVVNDRNRCQERLYKVKFSGLEMTPKPDRKYFVYDTLIHKHLKIELLRETGPSCFQRRMLYGELVSKHFGSIFIEPNSKRSGGEVEINEILQLSPGVKLKLNMFMHPPTANDDSELNLDAGSFESVNMPTNNEKLWGPIYLPRPTSDEHMCTVASHR